MRPGKFARPARPSGSQRGARQLRYGIGLAQQGQSFVAVLDPELAPGQPGAAALARRGERFDDRIPVGLYPIAVRTRHRVEPALESLIVEIVRQRPGQPRRLGPGEHMRDRPRAHPDRGGDLRTRQRKIVTVPENVVKSSDPSER